MDSPLEIRANMNGTKKPFEVQQQIMRALKDFHGAPTQDRKIYIGEFTGEVSFYLQYYLSTEINPIREALKSCDGINYESLRIIETVKVYH